MNRTGCVATNMVLLLEPEGATSAKNWRNKMNFKRKAGVALAAVGLLAAGCTEYEGSANSKEAALTDDLAKAYATNQAIPVASWSQMRQTKIEIEKMQINTTRTWTYFFAPGRDNAEPVFTCPSIGQPVPSTFQLSNPEAIAYRGQYGTISLPQMEPNGVFTGETDGTDVLCVDEKGKGYGVYWEGQVMASTLELVWADGQLRPKAGATSTHEFTVKK